MRYQSDELASTAGRLLRGEEKKARSRYEEDVLINNHTAVWGSYWRDGAWGYSCCHQFVKNSYCIGDAGSKAADEQTAQVHRLESPQKCLGHRQLLATGRATVTTSCPLHCTAVTTECRDMLLATP